jgi:hypothetical protein
MGASRIFSKINAKHLEVTAVDIAWLVAVLMFLHVTFGLIMIGYATGQHWPVAFLWAAGCAMIGQTIGFLFGVPRAKTRSANVSSDSSSQGRVALTYTVNTNLEQISDWLTKILVGLGLTQLEKIPATLRGAANYIADGVGGPTMQVFALAMIVFCTTTGFLGGYLLTRLFLTRALYQGDQPNLLVEKPISPEK